MAITAVNKVATTTVVSFRIVGTGPYTQTKRRYFGSFDLTGSGYSAAVVAIAQLIMNCTAFTSGIDAHLYVGSAADNWGATLDLTQADFDSTAVNSEETVDVAATGLYAWNISPAHLDYNAVNHIVMRCVPDLNYAGMGTASATFNTANAASNKPILRLTLIDGTVVNLPLRMGLRRMGPSLRR